MANPGPLSPKADAPRPAAGVPQDLAVPLVPKGGGAIPGALDRAPDGDPQTGGPQTGGPQTGGSQTGDIVGAGQIAPSDSARQPVKASAHTRVSATWTAVAGAMIFLVVVVVFLLENLQAVRVTFFGAHWRAPLAVDLLLSVVLGGLVVFCVGAVRIIQVRLHGRRQQRSSFKRRPAHGGTQVAGS